LRGSVPWGASAPVIFRGDRDGIAGLGGGHALDLHHVLKLAFLKPGTELGDIPIATVGLHDPALKTPAEQLVDDLQRELPLRGMTHILRDSRAFTAVLILLPRRRQEQPPPQRARRLI